MSEYLYEIEKGIPMPAANRGHDGYPWRKMEVNDSFFVPFKPEETTPESHRKAQRRIAIAANAFAKRLRQKRGEPCRFSTRIEPSGIRVWREE